MDSAKESSRYSSCKLYFKLVEFLHACNLSSVMGSIRSLSLFTLLSATYDMPYVFSNLPKSTQALLSVRPWLFWIVIVHANLNGSCCFSYFWPKFSETCVTGDIQTHLEKSSNREGSLQSSSNWTTHIGR